ncbi:MAG: DUF4097 family beta strand repeat protein [Candidatus Eisenbacteria sp.]|nr:DUF4097 family beta strand repeat protein [Candidatus Eisenbacteria bacterium]
MTPTNLVYRATLTGLLAIAAGILVPGADAEFQRGFSLDAEELKLVNFIGEIRIERADGARFEVLVDVRGEDAAEDLIEIQTTEGRHARVLILFPVDEQQHYVYPRLPRGSNTTFNARSLVERGGSLWDLLRSIGGEKIRVRRGGSGMELWADVTIKVPRGKRLELRHGVGEVIAEGTEGELELDTISGGVTARDISGDLLVDTGSGSVEIAGISGNVLVDTGSGSVKISDCRGEQITVDTGSGGVHADGIVCEELSIDTGSGRVRAYRIEADETEIDTGSGSVRLELDRMGSGDFIVDTGSGSIEIELPEDASAQVTADTGSGSIRVDVPGVRMHRRHADHISFRIGDGNSRVRLDAGSGSIQIRQS